MNPERWQQVEQVFHDALGVAAAERASFLARACGGDDELRHEVSALLRFEKEAEGFIEKPVLHAAAERLADNHPQLVNQGNLENTKFGEYQLLSLLGKGGMGEVYLARDLKLGREVAIKILPAEFAHDPDRLARFEREARLLAQAHHPNIASIYALEQDGSVRFLVLEYVAGETLAERLTAGPLPVKDALPILRQIADALHAAHEKGIVHRDLKPANIKITPQGVVKVLDFGLAKVSRHDVPTAQLSAVGAGTQTLTMTDAGMILGTVPYMSPEQTRGHAIDRRTDLWAFGCVCYETLAGARPFGGATTADTLAAILGREPNWRALPKNTPDAVLNLIRRCLQKDHVSRLGEAREAREALARALDDSSLLGTRLRRARWSARIALATTALVILVAVFAGYQIARHNTQPDDLATMLSRRMKGANLEWAITRLAPRTALAAEEDESANFDKVGNQRALDETIEKLKARLTNEPQSARLHAMLSGAYYLKYCITLSTGDKDLAVESCERALWLDPVSPEVQVMLGNLYVALGRFDQAALRFQAALAGDAQNFDATLGLAVANEAGNHFDEAEKLYQQAVKLRPDYWASHNELGGFYFAQGKLRDAVREWERVTLLAPLNPAGFTNLGNAHYAAGDLDRAEQAYRQSLSLRATAAGYVGLGTALFYKIDFDGAAREFEKATQMTPDRPEAWGNYADTLAALGRRDEAAAAYDKAITLVRKRLEASPEDVNFTTMLAEWLAKRGDKKEAVEKLEQALQRDRVACLSSAVTVYSCVGRRADALKALQEALKSGAYEARRFDLNPELASFRTDPAYEQIVQPHRNKN